MTLAGTRGLAWPLQRALVAEGYRVATGRAPLRIVVDAGVPLREAPDHRAHLLEGGSLLMLGGEGPLLARLHLTAYPDREVSGRAESFHESFPSLELPPCSPIHGVGYAFLRIGDEAVALGGARGAGHFVYLAPIEPPAELFCNALQWLSRPRL